MRKFSALVALALLAVAGTGLAVTCAYDNVPAATLLVPYFRVSRNGITGIGQDIPDVLGQTDTLVALTNVSNTGLIVHATVWSKYSLPVLDFNIPMTAFDVAAFRMKDVLNGKLNVNPNTQNGSTSADPCGINQATSVYAPSVGFGATKYIRFSNPNSGDARRSISRYQTPAFTGTFRRNVWDSLDESGDITTFSSVDGDFILDADNNCYIDEPPDASLSGDFSGYVTFDVVNYCTNFFPNQGEFFDNDAIATVGWGEAGYTPNAIMGDIFYIDSSDTAGNISGDPMVALEFDSRLDGALYAEGWGSFRTFYGRYSSVFPQDTGSNPLVPPAYRFVGDGREPLGTHYGFRYLNDAAAGLQTWIIVWRSDIYDNPDVSGDIDLCNWWVNGGPAGFGLFDEPHKLAVATYDTDENTFVTAGGPSPGTGGVDLYVFLETQRIDLLGNGDINPGAFKGGWIDILFPSATPIHNQAYVGVQHTGLAAFLSVGHSATLLNNQFLCSPSLYFEPGNTTVRVNETAAQ